MDLWHAITGGAVTVIGYFLREKHIELEEIKDRVHALEIRAAVGDNKMDAMDKKLDRLLEKLGA